ncbi:MAG: shikimate dehydrogenase [Methyloceanibacter sp.]
MKRACVIGWPVEHSRSPLIHRYWLKQYGIDGAYEKEAVPPGEAETFLRALAERDYVGANVTLPHKLAALQAADAADEAAYAIGAANTVWLDSLGKLNATNTDAAGFMANLNEQAPQWNASRQPALVIGAGGAARAILYALLEAGAAKVLLTNRTSERAAALADYFGPMSATPNWVEMVDWKDRSLAVGECGLIVNTTSLGMTGEKPLELDLARLREDAVVADIVYAPLVTPLLAAVRNRGRATVDGLGMLLHQAVPGFERWFGVRPEVTPELRSHVAVSLGAA